MKGVFLFQHLANLASDNLDVFQIDFFAGSKGVPPHQQLTIGLRIQYCLTKVGGRFQGRTNVLLEQFLLKPSS